MNELRLELDYAECIAPYCVISKKTYKGIKSSLFCFCLLNLKVVSIADNAVQIQIDKEDYSIADIVHRELLNVKHVKFAGVPPPHPLLKTLTIQVHTDGASPMKLINEAR